MIALIRGSANTLLMADSGFQTSVNGRIRYSEWLIESEPKSSIAAWQRSGGTTLSKRKYPCVTNRAISREVRRRSSVDM